MNEEKSEDFDVRDVSADIGQVSEYKRAEKEKKAGKTKAGVPEAKKKSRGGAPADKVEKPAKLTLGEEWLVIAKKGAQAVVSMSKASGDTSKRMLRFAFSGAHQEAGPYPAVGEKGLQDLVEALVDYMEAAWQEKWPAVLGSADGFRDMSAMVFGEKLVYLCGTIADGAHSHPGKYVNPNSKGRWLVPPADEKSAYLTSRSAGRVRWLTSCMSHNPGATDPGFFLYASFDVVDENGSARITTLCKLIAESNPLVLSILADRVGRDSKSLREKLGTLLATAWPDDSRDQRAERVGRVVNAASDFMRHSKAKTVDAELVADSIDALADVDALSTESGEGAAMAAILAGKIVASDEAIARSVKIWAEAFSNSHATESLKNVELPKIKWPNFECNGWRYSELVALPSLAVFNSLRRMDYHARDSGLSLRRTTFAVGSGQAQNISVAATHTGGAIPALMCEPPRVIETVASRLIARTHSKYGIMGRPGKDLIERIKASALEMKDWPNENKTKRLRWLARMHAVEALGDLCDLRDELIEEPELLGKIGMRVHPAILGVLRAAAGAGAMGRVGSSDAIAARHEWIELLKTKEILEVLAAHTEGDQAKYMDALWSHVKKMIG